MPLPPRWHGDPGEHAVLVVRRGIGWAAFVGGRLLGDGFGTERDARRAAAERTLHLEATALALLRRVRRGLLRKMS